MEQDLVGTDILDGKYKVKKFIGNGSYGYVFLVQRNQDGKEFVIKIDFAYPDIEESGVKKEYE
jgi:5-methylthioribose kinase